MYDRLTLLDQKMLWSFIKMLGKTLPPRQSEVLSLSEIPAYLCPCASCLEETPLPSEVNMVAKLKTYMVHFPVASLNDRLMVHRFVPCRLSLEPVNACLVPIVGPDVLSA